MIALMILFSLVQNSRPSLVVNQYRERYDLSNVGRLKINSRLGLETDLEKRILENDDIIQIIKYLAELKDGIGEIDDIDHLGNRRVRSVGELLENQYTLGVIRMERAIKERMSNSEIEIVMPNDLVNPKPASASVRVIFWSKSAISIHGSN